MASLIEVKQKINSTKNTKKITRAMQLVAANKMKGFQAKAFSTREYALKLLKSAHMLKANFEKTPYGEIRTEGPTLFVLLTSDKGLCGAMNNRLINELFRSEEWNRLKPEERVLLTVGKKSKQAARRMGVEPAKSYEGIFEDMTAFRALTLVSRIVQFWEDRACREIVLVSPHYINPFTIHTTKKKYLPISEDMLQSHFDWIDSGDVAEQAAGILLDESDMEPGEDRMIEVLTQQLMNALFIQAFYELKASEYSARMVAMKKATEAADDMISSLTLSYNKARQAKITQELAELSAGTAAIT